MEIEEFKLSKYTLYRCNKNIQGDLSNAFNTLIILAHGSEIDLAPNSVYLNPMRRGFFTPIKSVLNFYVPLGHTLHTTEREKDEVLSCALLNDLELYTETDKTKEIRNYYLSDIKNLFTQNQIRLIIKSSYWEATLAKFKSIPDIVTITPDSKHIGTLKELIDLLPFKYAQINCFCCRSTNSTFYHVLPKQLGKYWDPKKQISEAKKKPSRAIRRNQLQLISFKDQMDIFKEGPRMTW